MITIISESNIEAINNAAGDLLNFLKAKKIFVVNLNGNRSDDRVKANTDYFILDRLLNNKESQRFQRIEAPCSEDFIQLNTLVDNLNQLVLNKRQFKLFKIKDYSTNVIIKKLCRELVSELEDLFILGEINQSDIESVYALLEKPLPKKFKFQEVAGQALQVFSAIKNEIRHEASDIKSKTIEHYKELVAKIDPDNSSSSIKEFANLAKRKLSDISALRLCIACKYDEDEFIKMVDVEFEQMLSIAASKIVDNSPFSEEPSISVNSVRVGGKGFDIHAKVNGKALFARAIPVDGYFVRFHYRYIIT
jgi:hypothetical protein